MKNQIVYALIIFAALLSGCGNEQKPVRTTDKSSSEAVRVPDFNADSAYLFVEKQVLFGPRVPNTKEHAACAEYLSSALQRFTDTVVVQSFSARAFNGTVLNGKNIIGIFNPEMANRIVVCAHWDSRPFADYDPDPENHNEPIDGANDGASGVGVLLEIARQLSSNSPRIGVDIIFFDLEDYGPPQDAQQRGQGNWWALGSQYWSRNPHQVNYNARFGILLDMVGAEDARFKMEGFSMLYAPDLVKKVWSIGNRLGYGDYFLFEQGGYIEDDHKYVNEIAKIPTINIIHLDSQSANGSFFDHWHTLNDTMENISPFTLKVVGQTVLTVIFNEK
jgi:glutaminyl-peptide cyclotransferase